MSLLLSRILRGLFAALSLAMLPADAVAQRGKTFFSLEGRICAAARVYHGSIAEIKTTVAVPADGSRQDLRSTGKYLRYELTIDVDEVLKGPESKTVRLFVERPGHEKILDRFAERQTKLLIFVTDVDRAEGRHPLENPVWAPWSYLILGSLERGEEMYAPLAPPIFSKDVSVLREPKSILEHARDFSTRYPEDRDTHNLSIPRATARLCVAPADANTLVVPIEPELEATAKRMMSAPQEFIADKEVDESTRDELRWAGAAALQHFPSESNKRLLKSLLNDPMRGDRYVDRGHREWVYPIRHEAWTILKSWKVDVPKPVITEPFSAEPQD